MLSQFNQFGDSKEESAMNPRDREKLMLDRCVLAARSLAGPINAENGREANIFRVAAMVIQSSFPTESKSLMVCANRYFAENPHELAPVVNVIHQGDVISLPRLRDSLTRKFNAVR
jgi:hypothetical protein